jgi:hypothetical protein
MVCFNIFIKLFQLNTYLIRELTIDQRFGTFIYELYLNMS